MEVGQPFNPYKMFVGLFIPRGISQLKTITASAKLLWGALNSHSGEDGLVHPSLEKLAEEIGCSYANVRKAMDVLVAERLIVKIPPTGVERLHHLNNKYGFLWHGCLEGSTKSAPRTATPVAVGAVTPVAVLCKQPIVNTHTAEGGGACGKVCKVYIAKWTDRYKRPIPKFTKADAGRLEEVWNISGQNMSEVKRILSNFFNCDAKFAHGHSTSLLLSSIQSWVVDPPPRQQPRSRFNGNGYGGNGHPAETVPAPTCRILTTNTPIED